jgi:hypothetical protein
MSYTTILYIYPGEKIKCGKELRNAWGSAPYVWDYLFKSYIDSSGNFLLENNSKKLWSLWKRSDIPPFLRTILVMTFDRAYVSKKNYLRASQDIRNFLNIYNNTDVVNHWNPIAAFFESDPDYPAIGFWMTSVSENPFDGNWNEKKGEYDSPDWNNCYDVYNLLENKIE